MFYVSLIHIPSSHIPSIHRNALLFGAALANEAMDARRSWITTSLDHHDTKYSLDDYFYNRHNIKQEDDDHGEPHVVHV